MPNSETIDASQLYETGNKKFFAATLNPDGTFGTKEYYEGLMEVKIDFSQEITNIGADDIADYIGLSSPLQGEGTVKFAVLPYNIYSKFFDVREDANGAIIIGKGKPKTVAFGYYSSLGDGSESMFTLYRAVFSLPSLNSVSYDGKTIRDLTLSVKTNPYHYTTADGKKDQATYTILNSEINKEIWNNVQETIYLPDAEVAAE